MAKSRKKQRRSAGQRPPTPEDELLEALADALESPTPGPLLAIAGTLLSATVGEVAPPVTELVAGLDDFDRPETAAALLAIATLTGDVELRSRLRREIGAAGQVLPRWLADLDRTEPGDRAVQISSVYGEVDHLLVSATVPGSHPLTAVVRVDNELGGYATDGFLVEQPLDAVVPQILENAGPDAAAHDLPTVDARARIEVALRDLPGAGREEDWTEQRALIAWLAGLLPPGGEVPDSELSDDELAGIAQDFLGSAVGTAWSTADLRPLLDDVLASASGNGRGDPLIWSPHNVQRLLDPELWFLDAETPSLERAPELLRDLIRYGHAERGLRPELTRIALAAVDSAATAFVAAVRRLAEDDADPE
ncbi:hypothetical protein SAMN05660748_3041 [Blastococcus aggregatus]|uniref:Uncharacterized protein n=1 Tax=Blastococcus aggregatus TaxID=38502 RepID=A0A285V843_9ACTN|nr:hypothetical protein [Blastococcus aggregatus]SOC50295.1 hypothetical protein SAMN05660748_3041 [Blastococcus aggregatus]